MNPTLLPADPHHRPIIQELTTTIQLAQAVYGAVCFWSIGPDIVPGLAELLAKPGSFCIADIHLPTNIDKLNLFHGEKGNIYLFFKELNPKNKYAYIQHHLLHTKMLLFDLPNGQAELWVGSHNFTKQALTGINREASLVVPCQHGDPIYSQAHDYLKSILRDPDCRAFNPDLLDTYKRLQGMPPEDKEGGVEVLRVAWHSAQLPDLTQEMILLAGHDSAELTQFTTLLGALNKESKQFAVLAFDLDGGPSRKYTASIHNQGTVSPTDPATYDIAFGERHLAVRIGTRLPLIAAQQQQHPASTLRNFAYWVSIRIGDELPDSVQFVDDTTSTEAKWKPDKRANQLFFQELKPDNLPVDASLQSLTSESFAEQNALELLAGRPIRESSYSRLFRWLSRTRYRRMRASPVALSVGHAIFSTTDVLPESLADLEAQFSIDNLVTLHEQYERPLLEAVSSGQLINSDDKEEGPQTKKLIKHYIIR